MRLARHGLSTTAIAPTAWPEGPLLLHRLPAAASAPGWLPPAAMPAPAPGRDGALPALADKPGPAEAVARMGVEPAADIALADWADLMAAVMARLQQLAAPPAAAEAPDPLAPAGALPWHAVVLDCVGALGQLQRSLRFELGRLPALQGVPAGDPPSATAAAPVAGRAAR